MLLPVIFKVSSHLLRVITTVEKGVGDGRSSYKKSENTREII